MSATTRRATGINVGDPTRATLADLFSLQPPEWYGDALCAQTEPEAFFPEQGGSAKEGKATCAACPVREKCLDYALDNHERFGVWGGLTERERGRILRRRKAATLLEAS